MNNAELNQFATVPTNQTLRRSIFNLAHSNKFTARVGDLIPFECMEIIAGDTITMNQAQLLRSITPTFPTMDNAYVDFFYFFVPYRICFLSETGKLNEKVWERINGENTSSYWAPQEETEAYTTLIGEIEAQSACDYLGLPIGDFTECGEEFNPAPVVAYGLIWNEFFRDQNIEAPIVDWFTFIEDMKTGILHSKKFHDYYTSALPSQQRGDPVVISIGGEAPVLAKKPDGQIPVLLNSDQVMEVYATDSLGHDYNIGFSSTFIDPDQHYTMGAYWTPTGKNDDEAFHAVTIDDYGIYHRGVEAESFEGHNPYPFKVKTNGIQGNADFMKVEPYANLGDVSVISINDLRLAFATQKMLERDARSGTRYIEMLRARWNITIKDETIQRPQYIGGKRIPLNITQVNQTSSTDESSPLGRSGAFSLTTGQNIVFQQSFKEAGYLIGLMTIRLANTYKNGLPLMFSRKNRLHWYQPEFANIGEQSIYNKELFLDGNAKNNNNGTYGFKEAWAESRYEQNKLKGKFKDPDELILKSWTYAQEFNELPTLNSDFITQTREPFLKTLAVEETDYDYIVDIYEKIKATRPMPTYSIPSLIDHN